jgi:hypothetical protein
MPDGGGAAWRKGDHHVRVDAKGIKTKISRQDYVQLCDNEGKETVRPENAVAMSNTSFMTLGASVSSKENWKKCGSWKTQDRMMDVRAAGAKRVSNGDKRRASELVFCKTTKNLECGVLSMPYTPEWLD